MLVKDRNDVRHLPRGSFSLVYDGEEFTAHIDRRYAASAVDHLLSAGTIGDFGTQAEVVAEAINTHNWDIGLLGYKAKT
jgi:hypothetical protein